MDHKVAIHWFRRDLRLTDNSALLAACGAAKEVVPVYVLSGWGAPHPWPGAKRQAFLAECLAGLAGNLEHKGSSLVVRCGCASDVLPELAAETGATAVFCNRDPDPAGRATEQKLHRLLEGAGIAFHTLKDHALHERDEVLTGGGTPYRVFTPYSRRWFSLDKPDPQPAPHRISTPRGLAGLPLPTAAHWGYPDDTPGAELAAGERAARLRMKDALAPGGPVTRYAEERDTPAGQTTSRLSQDLRFGLLSIRELFARARDAGEAATDPAERESYHTFLKELAWREFYMGILWHFPEVLEQEFNPDWRGLPWRDDPGDEGYLRWCEGNTGFPIVDAGMRQLRATGFMHNRVRMIVSMFLTKDLHVDWRLGEKFFMQELVDGEIASNNGGWQWSAGTGADAAPYFRIQNPWTQTARYDPEGEYIRRWVPELAGLAPKKLAAPPPDGKPLAPGYHPPLVDHKTERERTLALFAAHRDN